MRKLLLIAFSIVLCISISGCMSRQGSAQTGISISRDIPTNTSVNVAWGGGMCEANGYVYYISARDPQETIIRINQDGSNPTVVTDGYYYIGGLTADNNNIYFVAKAESSNTGMIYRLPLNGGKAQKLIEGNVRALQNVNGRLYWEDYNCPEGVITNDTVTTIQIKSMNPDGSDLKTPLTLTVPTLDEGPFYFLAIADGIYYSTATVNTDDYSEYSDVYHMDLSGESPAKLNNDPLRCIHKLFYDRGKLYLLVENDLSADPFSSSVVTLDQGGETKAVLNHVGYFPQDFACIEYCGISDGTIYYFTMKKTAGSSASILMNFHQYDIDKNKDVIIKRNVDMGDSSVGTIASLRGKSMKGNSVGLYILGNDTYFAPFQMP